MLMSNEGRRYRNVVKVEDPFRVPVFFYCVLADHHFFFWYCFALLLCD